MVSRETKARRKLAKHPELKKLTSEGMIEYEIQIAGQVLEKKLYSITEEGKRDFMNWLSQIEPMESTSKEVFNLRLFQQASIGSETAVT